MAIEKKQETNAIATNCFFVCQFVVHSMFRMADRPGYPSMVDVNREKVIVSLLF